MKGLTTAVLLGIAVHGEAQSYDFEATVVDGKTGEPIPNTYVVNKATTTGTATNGVGEFQIPVTQGDTLIISNVGYMFEYITVVEKDSMETEIALQERNYLLDEVSIYAINSNKPKAMPKGEPTVPKDEDIDIPDPVAPTLANPVDFLYYAFGKRPQQLQALKELQKSDAYRSKLEEGTNREILEELTGIPKEEMEAFMFFCKYSKVEIQTWNDYQFLNTLLSCYEEYQRIKEQEAVQDSINNSNTVIYEPASQPE